MMKLKNHRIEKEVVITGIIVLGFIQCFAFYYGIDGTFRTIVAFIIACAIGISIPKEKIIK